jgi:hypothetical protein
MRHGHRGMKTALPHRGGGGKAAPPFCNGSQLGQLAGFNGLHKDIPLSRRLLHMGVINALAHGGRQSTLVQPRQNRQEAADGLDPTRRPPPAADPDSRVKWRLGSDLSGVVPRIPRCSPANGGVTPQNQTLSSFAPAPRPKGEPQGASPAGWGLHRPVSGWTPFLRPSCCTELRKNR